MRKTLLIAASALAASVISSQAGVYSQNVVGYANVAAPVGGSDYLLTVPFSIGASNGVNEVFGNTLSAGSQVLLWNGSGFTTYIYDNTDPANLGTSVVWYLSDDFTAASPLPKLPPGLGFFLIPNTPVTNVFAGAVAVNVGTSNNMVLATGGGDYFVGSVVPYAGAVTNGNSSTGGPNLNGLSAGTQLLFWNGGGFTTVIYDNTDPANLGTSVVWYASDDFTPVPVPTLTVGEGFLLIPNAPYTWTTGL